MKDFKFLNQVQNSLQAVNGYISPFSIDEFLVPSKSMNQFIVKETGDNSEIMVFLEERLLEIFSSKNFPSDFNLELFPDLSVVIEELSHFNTYCLSAIEDKEISQVELEVQAEVDKFAVALEYLEQKNESDLRGRIFETQFENFKLGDWVTPEDRERYLDAHQIARNFCRRILERNLDSSERRARFRAFFLSPRAQKLSSKY